MSGVLFYTASIGFCIGIFARTFFQYGMVEIVWVLMVSFALALLWRRKSRAFSSPYLLVTCVFLLLFSFGSLRMEIASWSVTNSTFESQLNSHISLEGIVAREPDVRESTQRLHVKSNNELLLVTTDRYAEVSYGDRITFAGMLEKPEPFETDLGRTFNYTGYLQAQGVVYSVSFAQVEVVSSGHKNLIIASLLQFKHAFMTKIEMVIPQPEVGLGEGLLLGVKQALGDEIENAFRVTGITHIVVLSGYNVMIVVTFIMYFLAMVLPLRGRLVFGAIAIAMFACMVGFSATVVRASFMAVLLLVAKATGRTYAVIRALVFTGVVMLINNPYLLAYDVGFQLSFVATLGLIFIAPHVEKYLGFMPTHLGLREFLTATISAQIFVMPILLYQIGQFSVVAVVVNVLVLPMVPVAMLLTFVTGMVGFVSTTLSLPLAYISSLSLSYILIVAQNFAKLPFASFVVPAFPFYIVIVAYVLLAMALWHWYVRRDVKGSPVSSWTIEEEKSVQLDVERNHVDVETPIFFR